MYFQYRKLSLQIFQFTNDKLSIRKRLRCASWNPEYLIMHLKLWILMQGRGKFLRHEEGYMGEKL